MYEDEVRGDLSVYDSLCWSDIFSSTVPGQAGIVLRTLAAEVRRLNKVIFDAGKV